ncbi:MAG TPA: hypothetical protein VFJ07_14495 [Streptosporangiaceae bacterium]|nr:hypothetical protein [Streptosporangiaceae bacterium]
MRYARPLIAGSAAVLAATLGATAAFAATTWTIKPGGGITATGMKVVSTDTKTRSNWTCQSVTVTGKLKSGSGLSGSGAGSVSAVTFNTCTNPLGRTPPNPQRVTFKITATDLPWHINFGSFSTGVATGSISHVQMQLQGPGCTAVLGGTSATATDGHVRFRYTNSTGRLNILTTGGNLHFYNVMGCAGLWNNNDPLTVSGTFPLSPKQVITSP